MSGAAPGLALVLGLGRFGGGREAARFLLRHGWRLRVADRAAANELATEVAALRADDGEIDWRLGEEGADLLEGVELVVVNPGVAPAHAVLTAARQRGVRCTQEVNLLLEAFPGTVVLVTGTDGKSTTATLTARALRAGGGEVLLGGNIGRSLLADEPAWSPRSIAVVEISSFQLERLDPERHRVAGAVLTEVTRDHLDRHGTVDAYHRAKAVAAAVADDFLVHLERDPVARAFASPARRRVRCTREPPQAGQVGCAGGWIVSGLADPGPVLHASALRMPGAFQVDNAMLAFAAASLSGAPRHAAAVAIACEPPLRYRLQRLLTHRGIELYDNSVSTHLPSTVSALDALPPPVHWVGGGKTKDGDFATVARAIGSHPHVRSAHLFGAAAEPLGTLLRGFCATTVHERLEDALDAAWSSAQPGDRVLFSPAFASFDQFANFRARASAFHAWSARLQDLKPRAGERSSAGHVRADAPTRGDAGVTGTIRSAERDAQS